MHHFQHCADYYYYACGDIEKAALYDAASSIMWLFAEGIAATGASFGVDPISRRLQRPAVQPYDVLQRQLNTLAEELRKPTKGWPQ